MQPQVQHMLEKLRHLSPERLTEVDDFIDFLSERDQDQQLRQSYVHASEKAFNHVWDNNDDAIYDSL